MEPKKKINPFIKSSVIYIIATIIGQGMTFLGVVVFTRLMGQAEYGEYSTYYACVSILTVLIGGNLYYALNNAYIEKNDEIKGFRKSVLGLSLIIMVIETAILLIVNPLSTDRFSVVIIAFAAMHSYGFFVVSYRIYSANMENDYKKKLWLLILPNIMQFAIALGLILFLPGFTFEARVIGSAIGVDIVASCVFVEMMQCKGKIINEGYWKYAVSIAAPTIVMSLSYMLLQQCDKVMIERICGAEETAIYSVIYYIGYMMVAVDQAAAPVRQAWIFRRLDGGNVSEARKIQKCYLTAMGIMAAILILLGPEIVKLFLPKNYWRMEYIVPFVLSACMMLLYRFYVELILFFKKNTALSVCVLICALLNIALNAWLIPFFGAVTACYTTAVSYGLLFVLMWILSDRNVKGVYSSRYFAVFLLMVLIVAFGFSLTKGSPFARYMMLIVTMIGALGYVRRSIDEWRSFLWEEK